MERNVRWRSCKPRARLGDTCRVSSQAVVACYAPEDWNLIISEAHACR